jgi:hypothetical protein
MSSPSGDGFVKHALDVARAATVGAGAAGRLEGALKLSPNF